MVSRLDGYNFADVQQLILRSGLSTSIGNTENSNILLDVALTPNANAQAVMSDKYQASYDFLAGTSYPTQFDTADVLITSQENLLAYMLTTWEPENCFVEFDFISGSFASLFSAFTASSFDANNNPNHHISAAELVHQGVSACHVYTYEVYDIAGLKTETLLQTYLPLGGQSQYNLAEAFYMSDPYLSSSVVLIGDPKSGIRPSALSVSKHQLESKPYIFENPFSDKIKITITEKDIQILSIQLIDFTGKIILQQKEILLETNEISSGSYLLKIESSKGTFFEKVVKK